MNSLKHQPSQKQSSNFNYPPLFFTGLMFTLACSIPLMMIGYPSFATLLIFTSITIGVWTSYTRYRYLYKLNLAQSTAINQAQQLLCKPIQRLIENPDAVEPFLDILSLAANQIGHSDIAIYMVDEKNESLTLFAMSNSESEHSWPSQVAPSILNVISISNNTLVEIDTQLGVDKCMAIGLYDDKSLYGFLSINPCISGFWDKSFLISVAEQLTEIICSCHRAQLNRRQDVYQERAAITRELHDSLAQSLTYLKFQSTNLQAHVNQRKISVSLSFTNIDNAIIGLRNNLNLAYSQLRELMTTFRLTMNKKISLWLSKNPLSNLSSALRLQ